MTIIYGSVDLDARQFISAIPTSNVPSFQVGSKFNKFYVFFHAQLKQCV